MPIREESFRIGCGRYTQKCGNIGTLGDEVLRFGSSPLIVGGKTALEITRTKIEGAVQGKQHAAPRNKQKGQFPLHFVYFMCRKETSTLSYKANLLGLEHHSEKRNLKTPIFWGIRSRWRKSRMGSSPSPTNVSKIHLHVQLFSQNI